LEDRLRSECNVVAIDSVRDVDLDRRPALNPNNAAEMFAFMGSYGVGPNSASGSAAHIGESCLSSVTEASGRRAGHDDHRDREQLPRTGSVSVIARISWRRECHP
jgi:hypothetical protein